MLDKLTMKDLPKGVVDIAQTIGMENFRKLVKLAGGGNIYIPSESSLTKPIRNRKIRESFDGNYREVATKFGISEVLARGIIDKKYN